MFSVRAFLSRPLHLTYVNFPFLRCPHERNESERFKGFAYDDLLKRDKVNLDIFWLRDESLEDSANLPDPDVLALEIAEELEAALEQFAAIAEDLKR
jgi:type I restriction enzyme M protein